ncbi:protein phosphatase CheZ [Sneathiella limimaris]|uniref:protein phosphatase CheZ n=1 Tax=Sneathiella limimaris TaxID=1964213 RepID=UPI00146CAC77|nr:protein phosphatase CheZ [Sneathiella limimaris]
MVPQDEVTALRAEINSLHADCRDLVTFIVSARSEISQIRPKDLKQDKLPRAGKELDAIVEATESATNQIMEATEKILSAKVTDADVVNDACMEIFEACSFQDITGQRISKVVSTLEYIETYLDKLTSAWGHDEDAAQSESAETDEEASLLNGPALAGEGIDQDFVDSMFDNGPAVEGEAKSDEAETSEKSEKKANKPLPAADESIDQDDIDALFN